MDGAPGRTRREGIRAPTRAESPRPSLAEFGRTNRTNGSELTPKHSTGRTLVCMRTHEWLSVGAGRAAHARTHARTNERTARRRWASSARTHARTHARSPPWPGFGKRDDAPTDRRSGDDSASSVQIRRRARSHGITYSANLEFHTCARQSLKVEASGWTVAPRKVPRARMASHCLDQPPISGCIGDQIAVQQNMHDNNELAASIDLICHTL